LRGTPSGGVVVERVMSDDNIETGELLRTSGGDQIFPKGLPVGTVASVSRGADALLSLHIKPAVNLSKLEEVLIIVGKEQRVPAVAENQSVRAADILARRLPSVPDAPPQQTPVASKGASAEHSQAPASVKPKTTVPKPEANIAAETGDASTKKPQAPPK